MRPLGKTGVNVTMLGLGTWLGAMQNGTPEEALAVATRALDLGITYFDTAPSYGASEERLGEALEGRRRDIFLATKTHERSYDGSMQLLEDSLKNLRTDFVDLWMLHNVATEGEMETVFAPGGALEAALQARDQKLVRFIGFSGHFDPAIQVEMIRRFDFDTVLCPVNAADWQRQPFLEMVLPQAVKKNMGIIGMKTLGGVDTHILSALSVEQALFYAWSQPVSVTIVGAGSPKHVETNVALTTAFRPYDAAKLRQVEKLLTVEQATASSWYKIA